MRTLRVTSPAFQAGDVLPERCTCDGADESPPLAWSGTPEGTRAYALVVEDPDAPSGAFVYWIAWDLPVEATGLRAKFNPRESPPTQGVNSFGRLGYGGPCPPIGHAAHRYHIRLYALDALLGLPAGSTRADLDAAMQGHVLGSAELMATHGRGR